MMSRIGMEAESSPFLETVPYASRAREQGVQGKARAARHRAWLRSRMRPTPKKRPEKTP
jgi:hypothetical protein